MKNIGHIKAYAPQIMASKVVCPKCKKEQYSPFSKLYTSLYEYCTDCTETEALVQNSEPIFNIIETT